MVVVRVHQPGNAELAVVVHADNSLRHSFRPGEGGQEQRRQDRDDGDDDEKLNQGETSPPGGGATPREMGRMAHSLKNVTAGP